MEFIAKNRLTLAVLVSAFLSACSTTGDKLASGADVENSAASEIQAELAELKSREGKLLERESTLSARESQINDRASRLEGQLAAARSKVAALENQRAISASPVAAAPAMVQGSNDLFPPNAGPGQCFARVFVEPEHKVINEKVLKRAASENIEIIPARYETMTEKVLIQEASSRLEIVPATYKWVTEQVLVKPATQRMEKVPAVYGTESEKVLVKAAHTVWKKGTGPIQKIDDATGEIMCLVEVPAVYKTVTKRVVKTPETTRMIDEPAVYKTVKKKVVDQAASTQRVEIPAKYKSLKVTKLISSAQEKRTVIPAEYQLITRTEKVKDGHMEWREILCETNMTRNKITSIQNALKAKGFNPGPIDGVIGWRTMRAVKSFQSKNNLPVDKYLNIQTVKALGVSPS